MKALLLSLFDYNITDKKTGEVTSGTNLYYVSEQVFYESMDYVGLFPAKLKVSNDIVDKQKLRKLQYPCLVDLTFESRPTPNGKSVSFLSKVDFVRNVNLFDEK